MNKRIISILLAIIGTASISFVVNILAGNLSFSEDWSFLLGFILLIVTLLLFFYDLRKTRLVKSSTISSVERPQVSIGKPEWYRLTSDEINLRSGIGVYLIRLACSFRPPADYDLEWARLSADLVGIDSIHPRILDIFPATLSKQSSNISLGVTPSLRFADIKDTPPEELLAKIDYSFQTPIVFGTGIQESSASWDFRPNKDYPLQGSWVLYLLAECPLSVQSFKIIIKVEATIATKLGPVILFSNQIGTSLSFTVPTNNGADK